MASTQLFLSLLFLAVFCGYATTAAVEDYNLVKRAATTAPARNATTAPKVNGTTTNKGNSSIEDRARANYANVIEELNAKFRGLKENCYPRPKGCLCVVGKASNGTEITERRMEQDKCTCTTGKADPECPTGGA